MVKLRADEHRYRVTAEGESEALVKQIPGCRFVAGLHAFQLPRQPGAVIALDRIFGPDGWECPSDLAQEVSETRSRQVTPAQQEATVALAGNELSVECAFIDKELVKLVPGYRWSAPQRRWFLPASPMALDLLREHFNGHLSVESDAAAYVELKRQDEWGALEKARRDAARLPARAETQLAPAVETSPASEDGVALAAQLAAAASSPGLVAPSALIERLTLAIEALEGTISRLSERLAGPVSLPEPMAESPAPEPVAPDVTSQGQSTWRDWIELVDSDPKEALNRISPQLQLAGEEALPQLRALAGVAASLTGDHEGALSFLRKSEEHSAVPLDGEVQRRARTAYRDSILALITLKCEPLRPIASRESLEELLLAELVHDSGFDDQQLASREALELLSFLMDDAHLRSFDAALSDYCRVLHLLSVARGGRWMAAERVVEMLRHRELTNDGFALGLVVLANTVFEQPCMDEWLLRWPPETSEIGSDDLRWIVASGVPRLSGIERTMAADASLAMLALISAAPVDVAQMEQRRDLVRLIPPSASARRYAEFLAAYQLAAAGNKRVAQDFPGYLQMLAQVPLAQSAGHLLTVFVSDSGGAASTTRRIAEEVFLESVLNRGVRDPDSEVLELLDMLAESPRGDNLLNTLARWVEEDEFPGAASFTHAQRLALFDRCLSQALKAGHDLDCVEAFDRISRELTKHGEIEALRTLCLGIPPGFKPLQMPVGQALLSLQLEADEEFEATAEALLRLCNPKDPADEGTHELKGLGVAFPQFKEFLERLDVPDVVVEPDLLKGRRLVVVGGHQWLRKHAMPQFEAWGVKTTWLDPDSAKNGAHALDLASGSTDLIVINTACISHAASGRVQEQARKANTRWAYHNSRGVGALLSIARESLADTAPPLADAKPTKHDRRKRLVR